MVCLASTKDEKSEARREAQAKKGARLCETEDGRMFWFLPESAKHRWQNAYDNDDWTGGNLYLTRRGQFVLREYSYWNVDFFNPPRAWYRVLSLGEAFAWLRENGFKVGPGDVSIAEDLPIFQYPGEYEV